VFSYLLWALWCLTIPAYPIMQIIAVLRTSGTLRWIAALPLLVMVPAYGLFLFGIAQRGNHNLSWLPLVVPSPVALLFVTIVVVSRFLLPGEKSSPAT
jgi:hypothetical protein